MPDRKHKKLQYFKEHPESAAQKRHKTFIKYIARNPAGVACLPKEGSTCTPRLVLQTAQSSIY
jgi:hypothetical protein